MSDQMAVLSRLKRYAVILLHAAKHLRTNNGFTNAGAIAYYSLLSLIPALTLIYLLLSHLIDPLHVQGILQKFLPLLAPGAVEGILNQTRALLRSAEVVGALSIVSLLIFSGLAVRTIEIAFDQIFAHRPHAALRPMWFSIILPYLYVAALALGVVLIVLLDAAWGYLQIAAHVPSLQTAAWLDTFFSVVFGLFAETVLLTSFYLIMPVGKTAWRFAIVGGFSAAVFWEVTRQFMMYWYAKVSTVNLIYGTYTTVVVTLLMLEAAALILLFGGQVIADAEQATPS